MDTVDRITSCAIFLSLNDLMKVFVIDNDDVEVESGRMKL